MRRIKEVTSWRVVRRLLRCKIAGGYSFRRSYETNCCFHAASGFRGSRGDARSGAKTYQSGRKCAPIAQVGQEATEDVEQGEQEAGQSAKEIRKAGTEGDKKSESRFSESPGAEKIDFRIALDRRTNIFPATSDLRRPHIDFSVINARSMNLSQ